MEIGDFLLHLSHDLRSSLRAIRVNAEWLAKDLQAGKTADLGQHAAIIVTDTARIDLLANGLAAFSIACQIDPASFVVFSTESILRKVLARLAPDLRDHSAAVTSGPLPRVRCEPDQIAQVFENVIRNALVHCQETPPKIHVSCELKGDCCVFCVRDNGPGIEPRELERIFKPFERLRGHQSPGPGLGLAISREIVERHRGKMWAESQAGGGASFFFTLPA